MVEEKKDFGERRIFFVKDETVLCLDRNSDTWWIYF